MRCPPTLRIDCRHSCRASSLTLWVLATLLTAACGTSPAPQLQPLVTPDDAQADAVVAPDAAGDDVATAEDATATGDATTADSLIGPDVAPDVPPCDPKACDDGNVCTADACDPATGKCVHAPQPGCGSVLAPCASQPDCKTGVCDPSLGACVACLKSTDCAANSVCLAKKCVPATTCKSDSQCKATQQVCSKTDAVCVDCNDKADCGADEQCVGQQCVPAPKPCSSSKDCPQVCDKIKGVCVGCVTSTDCPASHFCDASQQCAPDVCGGTSCAGGQVMTCKADGSGYEAPKACNDGNPCTEDSCQIAAGCTATPNSAACDDGNACTPVDTCSGGTCKGTGTPKCDDGNPCTDDGCEPGPTPGNPSGGCTHKANTAPCDDGNGCSTGDVCQAGVCKGTGAPKCEDGNPCTEDGCAGGKCTFTPKTGACDDGSGCTGPDACKDGGCVPGPKKGCDDGNPCTDDSCDGATGKCVNSKKAGCATSLTSPCSSDGDCGKGTFCDTVLHACVTCAVDAHCPSGQFCQEHACKPGAACTSDVQCKATKQVCYVTGKACVDCNVDADCGVDQKCVQHACVVAKACKTSKDCPSVCNVAKGQCVECVSSADCATGQFCNPLGQCELPLCKSQSCIGSSLYACKTDGGGYSAAQACADGNGCTDDGCDGTKGCVFFPNAAPCSGTGACTSQCQNGSCVATGPVLFDVTLGTPADEGLESFTALADGTFLLVGRVYSGGSSTSDALLVRADGSGNQLWSKTIGTSAGTDAWFEGGAAPDGGLIAAGYKYSSAGSDDFWLVKFSAAGEVEWQKTHGGTKSERCYGYATFSDGYLLAGVTESKSTEDDGWLVRTDLSGAAKWNVTYGDSSYYEGFYHLAALPDGGAILTGEIKTASKDYDVWLVRVDKNGAKVWDKTIGGSGSDTGYNVTVMPDGGYALAGQWGNAAWVGRTDANGKLLWDLDLNNSGKAYGLVLQGSTLLATGENSTSSKSQGFLAAIDSSGKNSWWKLYGTDAQPDQLVRAAIVPGGLVLAGETDSKGAGQTDYWLQRTDPWGNATCSGAGKCLSTQPSACDDGNACTLDSCDPATGCKNTKLEGCCFKSTECDDGNPCTADACTGSECSHTFVGGAGCCNPTVWSDDFQDGQLAPWTASTLESGVGWQVDDESPGTTKLALYYGSDTYNDFSTGSVGNDGAATTPSITLPQTGKLTLRWKMWADIEDEPKYDTLEVFVEPDGKAIWAKGTSFTPKTWQTWTADLTPWAGKTIQLRFWFDTQDSTSNSGQGVYIDNVEVERSCP